MIILHRAQALQHVVTWQSSSIMDSWTFVWDTSNINHCAGSWTEYWKTSDFNRVLLRFQSADLGPVLALIGHIIHGAWSGTCHRFFTP